MELDEWVRLGQVAGLIGAGILACIGVFRGLVKSDGKPPVERPPAPNEVREAVVDLRRLIERVADRVERQGDQIERRDARFDDDLTDIKRGVERVEAAQRIQMAMEGLRRDPEPHRRPP